MQKLVKPFYETSDTPLAAWLYINGIPKPQVNKLVKPAIFLFDNSEQSRINDLIFAWDSGSATGNCMAFYKAYRMFIHILKEG